MRKNFIKIALLAFVLPVVASCAGFLDTKPRNVLPGDAIWNSNEAITAYMAKMYDEMQVEDFNFTAGEVIFPSMMTDEAIKSYTWGRDVNNVIIPDGMFEWWNYDVVRNVNDFIQKIDGAGVSDALKARYKAEARFIRAFHYFAMVKRYGGVPLLTTPQQYTGTDIEKLCVPRDKEQTIYDFIYTELKEVVDANALPETTGAPDRFRATKYAALALQSRAMLYAASIAKYSNITLPGDIVGIPSGLADGYWKKAKDAAEAIIKSANYSLYGLNSADKVSNFQNMFLEKKMHSEAIFTKAFAKPDKSHNFDFYNAPVTFKIDYGCATNPTADLIEEFDYVDGSNGKLKVADESGKPIKYANPYDLFKDKDPRLLASVLLPFSPWQGGVVEIRRGIILPDGKRLIPPDAKQTYGEGQNAITVMGKDGPMTKEDFTKTGSYIKKFMNPTEKLEDSDTYWMVFRYAEVLLNYAEAAMELGDSPTGDALTYINEIRTRAGVKTYDALDLAKVRKERKLELTFENHRWWDMIRWRISTEVLNNRTFKAIYPWLVWEEGKSPKDMSYIFEIVDSSRGPKTFLPKLYYYMIKTDQLSTNPLLIQNPGY